MKSFNISNQDITSIKFNGQMIETLFLVDTESDLKIRIKYDHENLAIAEEIESAIAKHFKIERLARRAFADHGEQYRKAYSLTTPDIHMSYSRPYDSVTFDQLRMEIEKFARNVLNTTLN